MAPWRKQSKQDDSIHFKPIKPAKQLVMENSFGKGLIAVAIWLGIPILSIIIMPFINAIGGVIPMFFYFLLPNIAIMASAVFIGGTDIVRAIFTSFKRTQREPNQTHDKSYGRSAIFVCMAVYALVGILFGIFSSQSFLGTLFTFSAIGAVWGFVVYQLFQKDIFDVHESF